MQTRIPTPVSMPRAYFPPAGHVCQGRLVTSAPFSKCMICLPASPETRNLPRRPKFGEICGRQEGFGFSGPEASGPTYQGVEPVARLSIILVPVAGLQLFKSYFATFVSVFSVQFFSETFLLSYVQHHMVYNIITCFSC
jgi:hypothetical protein